MNIEIGLFAGSALLVLVAGLLAYRHTRARRFAPAIGAQYPTELTEPDTQAGRI